MFLFLAGYVFTKGLLKISVENHAYLSSTVHALCFSLLSCVIVFPHEVIFPQLPISKIVTVSNKCRPGCFSPSLTHGDVFLLTQKSNGISSAHNLIQNLFLSSTTVVNIIENGSFNPVTQPTTCPICLTTSCFSISTGCSPWLNTLYPVLTNLIYVFGLTPETTLDLALHSQLVCHKNPFSTQATPFIDV